MPSYNPGSIRKVAQLKGTSSHPWLRQNYRLRPSSRIQIRGQQTLATIRPERKQLTQGFHSTATRLTAHDSSTIDFVLMPRYEVSHESPTEVMRIPLLPNNFSPLRRSPAHQEAVESVIRPEISTVSADGTHIASPSPMSEVTDNHAIELDPYDLTAKVNAAAKQMGELPSKKMKDVGVFKELWLSMLDDLLGGKKVGRV